MAESSAAGLPTESRELRSQISELERERSETAPTLSQQRLDLALEAAGMGTWEIDPQTGFVTASAATCAIFGFDDPPPRIEDWVARLHPEDRERVGADVQRAIATGSRQEAECRVVWPDGTTRWVSAKAVPVSDAAGRFIFLAGVTQDITERKLAEEQNRRLLAAVQEEKERLAALIASITDEIWFADSSGQLTLMNPAAMREFNIAGPVSIENLTSSLEVYRSDGSPRPRQEAGALRALKGELITNEENIVRTPASGQLRYRQFSATPVRNSSGEIVGSVSVVRDITERKRAEQALASDLAALARIHDLSKLQLGPLELQTVFQEIMDAAVDIVKADRGTLQLLDGNSLQIVAHHGHQPAFLEFFTNAEERASVCGEALKRGERVVVEDVERSALFAGTPSLAVLSAAGVRAVQSTPLLSRAGGLLGILTTQWSVPHVPDERDLWRVDLLARQAADLIEHSRSEAALRRLAQFPAENPNPVLRITPGSGVEYANGAAQDWLTGMGATQDKPLPVAIEALVVRAARERSAVHAELADEGGRTFWVTATQPPGEAYVNIYGSEITERKHAEQALRESEERLRLAQNAANVGIWDWHLGSGRLDWTPELERIYGYEPGTFAGSYAGFRDRVHPDDLVEAERLRDDAVKAHQAFDCDFRVCLPSGEIRWVNSKGSGSYDADGKPQRVFGVNVDITERKRAEEALRESEERFRVAQELSPDGFLIFRPLRDNTGAVTDFLWIYENDAAARMNDTNPKEVCGKRVSEVLPHHGESPFGKAYKEAAETGEVRVLEEALYDQDTFRQRRWFRVAAVPTSGGDIAVLVQNVTERKKAEEALRESEAQFRTLANAIPQLCWTANADGWIFWYNQRWYEYTGTTPEQMEGWGWQSVHDQKELPKVLERWKGSIATGKPFDMVFPLRGADGIFRPFLTRVLPVLDEDGKVVRWFGTNTDISEQRKTEEALRESEARFRQLADSMPQLVWVAEDDASIYYHSAKADAYQPVETTAEGKWLWQELIHPDDLETTLAAWRAAGAHGSYEHEHRVRMGDGSYRWHLSRARRITAAGTNRWYGSSTDIHDRKQSEERLFQAHQRLAALMQALPVGVSFSDDPSCERITGNPAVLAQFEVGPEDNLSASAPDPDAPGRQVRFFREGRAICDTELPLQRAVRYGRIIPPEELEVRMPSGRTWFAEGSGAPIRDQQGNIVGGVAVTVDVTERKRGEERLRHAQKLESIGILAGGIAHDFNNLLTGILGNASLLQLGARPEDAAQFQAIMEASERAAALTRQLLAYAGKGQTQIVDFDVRRMVRSTTDLIRVSIPKSVELELDIPRDLPMVHGDSSQIQQVLMNLVINAAEATQGRPDGRVCVAAEVKNLKAASAGRIGWGIDPGRYVVLTVQDNGCGMDERTMNQIFDPFFTTKFTGRGLGLAAVHGILRSHKGTITVESKPGHGSTFTVYLPCSEAEATATGSTGTLRVGRVGTVLIVDDEESVRGFSKAALERLGHTVLLAKNGEDALQVLRTRRAIDLVVLDIVMPVKGGAEALSEMRQKWPAVAVLVASGYSRLQALDVGIPEDVAYIQKPYTLQTLAAAVESALEAGAHAGE